MGRLMAFAGALAFIGPSLAWSESAVVAAPGPIRLVDGPGFLLVDASDDGRYVLTSMPAGPQHIIDVQTGQPIDIQPHPFGTYRLSGDGQLAYFSTNSQLTVDDTDGGEDIYSYAWASHTTRLVSPGWPGWEFSMDNGLPLGDAGRSNDVAFSGARSGEEWAAFVSDGSTVHRVGTNLPAGYGGSLDISGDGRYVLFRMDLHLYVEDRSAPAAIPVQVDVGLNAPWLKAALSADGRHVAIVAGTTIGGADPKTAYIRHLDSSQTVSLGAFAPVTLPIEGLGISADGSVVSLLRDTPTDTSSGTTMQPGMFVWRGGVFTEVSTPPIGNPNGQSRGGFVLPDGDTVVFDSEADNLVAGVTPPQNVYLRKMGVAPTPTSDPGAVEGEPSAYTPRVPLRILDTRSGPMPGPNTAVPVIIGGHFGVPADATAVAVQVTATQGNGVGFVGLTPGGGVPGHTSNLNIDTPGETIANLSIVPLGADGSIDVFTSFSSHLVVDLLGWWTPAAGAVAAGRFVPAVAARVLDTRPSTRVGYDGPKPAASSTTVIQVAGRGGVPTSGLSAVVVNITLDGATSAGFVQAGPADGLVPGATSTLNVAAPGQVVAAASIVPVDAQGRIALYAQPSTDLIVDIVGWFTDGSSSPSTSGRFVTAASVTRTLDTRPASAVGWTASKPSASATLVMPSIRAVLVGNLTLTETDGPGFVQIGSAAELVPGTTSAINASGAGETVANAFISQSANGLGIYSMMGTHVVVDVSGYMTG